MNRLLSLFALVGIGCAGTSTSASPSTPAVAGATPAHTPSAAPSEFFDVDEHERVQVGGALLPPMPVAVTSFGAIDAGGSLYVFGGYAGRPHVYDRTGQSPALWRLAEGEWSQVHTMTHGLQGAPLVELDGTPCRLGGTRIENAPGEPVRMVSLDQVACFVDGEWSERPSLPATRSSFDAARFGSRICVAGGWRLSGQVENAEWVDDVLCRDVRGGAWTSFPAPFRRRALATAGVHDTLVVIGGLDSARAITDEVHLLDVTSGEWRQGPRFPEEAFGVSATAVGDAVYASAGSGEVYRWSPGDDRWSRATSLAYPRFFHQLVARGDELVAIGGIGGMHTDGRVRHVERLPLQATSPRIAHWTVPWPGESKNRQAMFVEGEFLYLFGGNNSLGQHDFEPENFLSEGWRVHLPSMRIEPQPAFPAERQSMVVARIGERVVAMGGFGHDGEHAVSQRGVLAFEGPGEGWSELSELPRSRTQFGIAVSGERVSVIGGLNYDPRREGLAGFDHLSDVLSGDVARLELMPRDIELPPRRAFAGAVIGDDYYIVGGMRDGFALVEDCMVMHLETAQTEPMPCPERARLSGELLVHGSTLLLVGGSVQGDDGVEPTSEVLQFDPDNADAGWTPWMTLPFDMRHTRALAAGDRIVLVSTQFEEDVLRIAVVTP